MLTTNYYKNLFDNAYGSPVINEALILKALSHFICSMVSFDSKYDQSQDPSTGVNLTASELNGMAIFEQSCSVCHTDGVNLYLQGGPTYAFIKSFDNGMARDSSDLGAGEWNAAYS